jgi:pimeloyl-ACP methyl ester carboxylesterase
MALPRGFEDALGVGRTAARYLAEARPASRSFMSDGVPIHYTEVGDGPPVVLVHGFAVSGDLNWRLPGVTRKIARDYRVITVDLRGHGRSGKPHALEAYGDNLTLDIVRLLDHLGLERAHVAGYSLGGFVTLKLAVFAPERLLSASILGAGWEPPDNSALLDALPRLAESLEAGRGIGPVAGNLGSERKKPGLGHRLWVKLMTRYFNDQRALIGVIRSVPGLAVSEAELRAVTVPLCSIVGSRDPLIESARAMCDVVADLAVTVIPDADHIQAPARPELHAALRQFFESVEAGSAARA